MTIAEAPNRLDRMGEELSVNRRETEDDHRTSCTDPILPSISLTASFIDRTPVRGHNTYLGQSWQPLKKNLLRIISSRGQCTIPLFRSLHDAGVPNHVLRSIALLSTDSLLDHVRDDCVECAALYLISINHSYHSKLGCIRTLMILTSPKEALWQIEEGCLKETLNFLVDRAHDWAFPEHTEALLLWELRAICLWFLDLSEKVNRLDVDDVIKGSEVAAANIAGAAKWVEQGLKCSVPVIHIGLETAGDQLKGMITPTTGFENAATVANYTSAAKVATTGVREKAQKAADGIRDISVLGIHVAAKKFEEKQIGRTLVPDQNHRNVLVAAGRIVIATFGAAAVVGEAVFETTDSITRKTISVTADVVSYKYGDQVGQIVQDGCDTTGNILTTITKFAMLEGRVLTKAIAKNAGKVQFRKQYDTNRNQMRTERPVLFLDSTKADAMMILKKLQRKTTMFEKDSPSIARV
jgi:hypothetical protein